MTPLAQILRRNITATGPITIADYMRACLLHPEHGYYNTRDPFGATGDFITAPEISQMFGELVGLWLAQCWKDQGSPTPFVLGELGPGRGTLMADILRACKRVAGFVQGCKIVLIEASPALRAKQRETIDATNVEWVDRVSNLPKAPLFLVANEFFDALPIRQFTRHQNGWQEHQIALKNGQLVIGLSGPTRLSALEHRLGDTTPGDIVETCAPAAFIAGSLAAHISQYGGATLFVDYGDWRSLGDTFQALSDHQAEDPLARPGQADLTAHVDFEALAKSANPCQITNMTRQGVFLERLGITARAQQLALNLDDAALNTHVQAHRRLTHGTEMGNLFKTIAFFPNGAAPPPGFD